MIFVDSSYYIAIVDTKDQWHKKALELSEYIETNISVVSSFIISEVVTEIGRRSGGKVAYNLYNYFTDNCKIIYINRDLLSESMEIVLKYDGTLSLADATSVAIMDNMKIGEIISFDSDFDKVDFINRVHTLQ
ncbi:MAG: PIN domain-containing protein [Euryarchaeota archaeon]|nr:PIN domain-containing protein [Euryarchaeota archaeon]